jgi:hypothetical protein
MFYAMYDHDQDGEVTVPEIQQTLAGTLEDAAMLAEHEVADVTAVSQCIHSMWETIYANPTDNIRVEDFFCHETSSSTRLMNRQMFGEAYDTCFKCGAHRQAWMHHAHADATSLYEFWLELDNNGDGTLDHAEIEQELQSVVPANSQAVAACLHRHYAASGDVTMDVFCEEYGSYYDCCVDDPDADCAPPPDHCEERQIELWTTLIDTNSDGTATLDELMAWGQRWTQGWVSPMTGQPTQPWQYNAFAWCVPGWGGRWDANGDMSVSYEEYCGRLSSMAEAGECQAGIDCIEVSIDICAKQLFGWGNDIPDPIEYNYAD